MSVSIMPRVSSTMLPLRAGSASGICITRGRTVAICGR